MAAAAAFGLAFTGLAPASASEAKPASSDAQALALPAPAAPAPDSVEPQDVAGQYYTYCINMGVSHSWDGNAPESCPGYLDVYISGQHVAHLNMGATTATITWSCAIGVAVGTVSVFLPGGIPAGWAAVGVLTNMGLTLVGCAGY